MWEIRDEITIQNIDDSWKVVGFKPSEDRTFDDRDEAAEYATKIGQKHFRAVVWLPAEF